LQGTVGVAEIALVACALPSRNPLPPTDFALTRLLVGLLLAAVVSLLARRAGALDRSGAVAATFSGGIACAAGWSWAALLITYFVVTSALGRVGAATRQRRTSGVVAKGGARDWWQVLANGGVFVVAATLHAAGVTGDAVAALGAASLAAAAADSWATEIGTLSGGAPRSVLSFRRVPAGTSGAVSGQGTLAMLAGAAFMAAAALLLGWPRHLAIPVLLGGIAGAVIDTLAGAMVQARRRCPQCGTSTEQTRHECGATTEPAGGITWMDNDAVNLVCTVAGGLLAVLIVR